MPESRHRAQAEFVDYVRDLTYELSAMARIAGFDRLSFLLEVAALEATDVHDIGEEHIAAMPPLPVNAKSPRAGL
jgi:hypothetical protein